MDPSADSNADRRTWRLILLVLMTVAVVSLLPVIAYNDRDWPEWTGLGAYTHKIDNEQGKVTVVSTPRKTLWDMLGLLIVPAMLAGGAYWLNQSGKRRELQNQEYQAQETALQNYLDKITELLLKKEPIPKRSRRARRNRSRGPSLSDAERVVARSRTLTALRSLDGGRKGIIIRFLHESGLIISDSPVIDLNEANLKYATLTRADLHGINLYRAKLKQAQLIETNLSLANLSGADLTEGDLTGAILHGAKLSGATLTRANLSGAKFHTGELTMDELTALPLEEQRAQVRKGIQEAYGAITQGFEHAGEALLRGEAESKAKEVIRLQKELRIAISRREGWLRQDEEMVEKQIARERQVESIADGMALAELQDVFSEQPKRRETDTYRTLDKAVRELEYKLLEARRVVETYVRADLRGANFEWADLRGAELRWANLSKALLGNAKLQGSNLSNGDLTGTDLENANLTNANLTNANLTNANLTNANLTNANLTNANLSGVTVSDNQLAKAKSLKGARRNGPTLNDDNEATAPNPHPATVTQDNSSRSGS